MSSPFLQLLNISKQFAGVDALKDVSLSVGLGEVVGLIGENGAGKSTLMNILGGILQPDDGRIFISGAAVEIGNVSRAVELGIGFVHQELNNLDNLDVAGNIFLGREPVWGGVLKLMDRGRMVKESLPCLTRLGVKIDPRTPLRELSLAQQQLVEIARALAQRARILVLDEPTSSLTAGETERLLEVVKDLRSQQVSIIYITHRLGEIATVADRVVVLRDGRNAGELARGEITHEKMLELMIGRDPRGFFARSAGSIGEARLRVKDLSTTAWPGRSVSFEARGGEILGIAGLVGAGRSEMAEAIFGAREILSGEIWLQGKKIDVRHCRDAIAAGIFLVPEDRRKMGLIGRMTVRENITLTGLWKYSCAGLIQRTKETTEAKKQVESLHIKTPGVEAPVMNLSGGNQQKVVLGKWLALEPRVLMVDEPTRGIDVGAKAEIYRLLRGLADKTVAVILISSDMEEVLGISDRIAVMHEGAIAGTLERAEFSQEKVMSLAFGKVSQ